MLQKFLIVLIPLLLNLILNKKAQQEYVINGFAQGTDYTIKYFATDSVVKKQAIDSVLNVIDASMSLYKPTSAINKFNASTGGLILEKHFLKVMRRSFQIFNDTEGIFDVTVAPLVQAWGFGARPIMKFPDSNAIKAILPCIGMNHLTIKNSYLHKDKACVQVDLNGIAQGYSVDVVADLLVRRHVNSFIVEIGGEVRVNGLKPDGSAFRVGVEGPGKGEKGEPLLRKVILLKKGAITTSGNYRKFLQQGTSKYSHLINAKTGYPIKNEMISVTVVAEDAITADGYDNALMGMSLPRAMKFLKERNQLEAYIVYKKKDGSVGDTLTPGFKKMIVN